MKAFKEVLFAIVYLILGLGFLGLVAWEYNAGFAAGSYGGAAASENPGLFWFLIALQIAFGLNFILRFIKGIANILSTDAQISLLLEGGKTKIAQAVYQITKLAALCLLGFLGIWAAIDLSMLFYSTIRELEIMGRIMLGVFALLALGTFVGLLFYLMLIPYLKDLYPGAISSAKLLIDEIKTFKIRYKK